MELVATRRALAPTKPGIARRDQSECPLHIVEKDIFDNVNPPPVDQVEDCTMEGGRES